MDVSLHALHIILKCKCSLSHILSIQRLILYSLLSQKACPKIIVPTMPVQILQYVVHPGGAVGSHLTRQEVILPIILSLSVEQLAFPYSICNISSV